MMLLGIFLFIVGFWFWLMCITKEGRFVLALYFIVGILFTIAYLIHR